MTNDPEKIVPADIHPDVTNYRPSLAVGDRTLHGVLSRDQMDETGSISLADFEHTRQELRITANLVNRFRNRMEAMRRSLIDQGLECPFCRRPPDAHKHDCPLVRE